MAFLNKSGVERLWSHIISKLGEKVDKVDGKDLSTNDYTTAEKEKLANLNVADLQNQINAKVPTSRTVNGKALSANITLNASDVGADVSGAANEALTNAQEYTDNKISELTIPQNILDGTASGSLRQASSATENDNYTLGQNAVAFGEYTQAPGQGSLSQGNGSMAVGNYSHAEGNYARATEYFAHAEGNNTTASGYYSHAEGQNTTASNYSSHAEGQGTTASGSSSHAEGYETKALKSCSHAEGYQSTADGEYAHAEGQVTTASGTASHAEGQNTTASGIGSHAEGQSTTASGICSHAEGQSTKAVNQYSHAEGAGTTANGDYSHAEGCATKTTNTFAHAEGQSTTASGTASHAEGNYTESKGMYSHAEGYGAISEGNYSHAEGCYTIAKSEYQHVQGKYNIEDADSTYAHIVGNGAKANSRSNAYILDWDGNARFAGDVYVQGTGTTGTMEDAKKLATEDYVNSNAVQPDWNQNDPTAKDYIKNRTHWEEIGEPTIWVDNVTLNMTNTGSLYNPFTLPKQLVIGDEYIVIFNGTEYKCIAYTVPGPNTPGIGSTSFIGNNNGGGNGEPFLLFSFSEGQAINFYANGGATYTLTIKDSGNVVHKIPDKYLPSLSEMGAAARDHTHYPSSINGGTFYGQMAIASSYQPPSSSLLRNSKIINTETNPSYNGEIYWVYG